jgi:hypothetical protein
MAEEFNPNATDGDGDGMLQDGTQWERPVEADSSFVISDDDVKAVLVEEPVVAEAEEKVDDEVISTESTNSKPKKSKPALAPVNDGAIGSSAAEAAKPAKPAAKKSTKLESGKVAVFATRNVRWDGVGSLLRGYNIVSKEDADKWLTLATVREATPDEIKNLG